MDPITLGSILGFGGDLLGGLFGKSSADKANRTNIMLAREQRGWEAQMANTAVQRRAIDLEKAGFNRVLAATGAGAATPSVSAPTVEPTFRPEWLKGSTAAAVAMRANLDNVTAQTQNTSAQTRKTTAEAKILEQYGPASSAADLEGKQNKLKMFDSELRKAIAEADISEQQATLLKEKGPLLNKLLEAQGNLASLDYQSAEKIAAALGVVGKDAGTIVNLIITIARMWARK